MKRLVAISSTLMLFLVISAWTDDVWARAGGGKSSGSRGSHSASPPAERASTPSTAAPQAGAQAVAQPPMPQRSGWMSGMMGGLTGLLIGGAIGSLLFGGLGGGMFGGIGFVEILIIGAILYVAFVYMRRRQHTTPASPYGSTTRHGEEMSSGPAMVSMAGAEHDLARGLRHIQQMDAAFDPERFVETASDTFFIVQTAWTACDMASARSVLNPEMYETMRKGCEQLRDAGRINRLENISVRSMQVTEAWQETGFDFVTVHILASLLDYTVDVSGTQVSAGSRTTPVKFEEYWTFTRPCGPNAWQLSAIQQTDDPAQS